ASEALLSDVHYVDRGQHIELEVRLGLAAEIRSIAAPDQRTLQIGLRSLEGDLQSDWQAAELTFDEADRLLHAVSLEGSGRKGYLLTAQFSEPVHAQLMPQFETNQVLLQVTPHKVWRRLARFGRVRTGDPYVVELESRRRAVPELKDIPRALADTHAVYLTEVTKDDEIWQHLRLGFFTDRRSAERSARTLERYFPDARVEQVSEGEVRYAEVFKINPESQIPPAGQPTDPAAVVAAEEPPVDEVKVTVALVTPSNIGAEPDPVEPEATEWVAREAVPEAPPTELEQLQTDAREAFEAEDYRRAIALYARLVDANQEPYREHALEMLGVARELNGQEAHAKRYYETYLADYPESAGADRVQQRLAALVALSRPANPATRDPIARQSTWEASAQVSQFYQRHSLKVDDRSTVPIDGLFNDFNAMVRRDGTALDQELYLLDFTNNERLNGRENQVSTAYWEGTVERLRSEVRLGRQSRWDSGALGRFDGAAFTYRYSDRFALGLTGGYLIDSSFDAPGGNRPFFGINGEYLSDAGNLSIKPFYVQQYVDGVIDRQALGLQSQVYTDRFMLFSLVDYDLHHSALNNFTLTGNFSLGRSRLNASYEHRMNPYLTTRNALMGQRFEDLTDLEAAILDLTLDEIAKDRTATSDTMRLGWNMKLGRLWSVSADVVASAFSSTESSADVAALDAHNTLYSSLQVRSQEIFGRGSYSAVMVRVADSQT
ncbi:MAG: hypothetical protein P8Y69_18460, partial [Gammaproteobacteria bacterium]